MGSNPPEPPIRPVARANTALNETPTPPVINEFLEKHWFISHCEFLANHAQDLIAKEIQKPVWEGLEASVTSRAKGEQSLREKLKMRHEKKPYQTTDDISRDIHDLAGVRIILYMPSEDQRNKVKKIIQSIWGSDIEAKLHDGSASRTNDPEGPEERNLSSNEKKYRARHLGYQAVHYRVAMKTVKTEHISKGTTWKENDRIEIQVVSALGHAWAQAGHDVLYKSYAHGAPTIQEQRILDSLNGIVLSGDLLLEQFHELVMKRTYTRWTHLSEFSIFLHELDVLQNQKRQHRFGTECLDVLLRFLTITKQNYPLKVRNAIKELWFQPFGGPEHSTLENYLAKAFNPVFEPAEGMLAIICLIHHLMPERKETEHAADKVSEAGAKECCTMISALTLLQNAIGGADPAKKFLRERITLSKEVRTSLEFVMTSPRRQLALDVKRENFQELQEVIKPDLQPAWSWFKQQEAEPMSICGFFLKIAEMGATREVGIDTLLKDLTIGSLSRSSMGTVDDEEEVEDRQ